MNPNMPPKKKRFVLYGFILLGLFVIMALIEEFGGFLTLDPSLTRSLQQLIPRSVDIPFSYFSVFGSLEVTSLILIVIALFLIKKEKLVPYSLGIFALVMVIEIIGKFFIFHPPPPEEYLRYALPFATPHYDLGNTFSFPSGHVARTTFLALVAVILTNKYVSNKKFKIALTAFIICFVIGMAISRVYLGEHWTSDVIGGLILGSALGLLAMVYYN